MVDEACASKIFVLEKYFQKKGLKIVEISCDERQISARSQGLTHLSAECSRILVLKILTLPHETKNF